MLNHLNMEKERWYDDCHVCNTMHQITPTLLNNATYIFVIEYMYWAQENICLHLGKCQALEYCVSYSRFVWPIFYDLSLVILLTFTHLSVDLDDVALAGCLHYRENRVCQMKKHLLWEKSRGRHLHHQNITIHMFVHRSTTICQGGLLGLVTACECDRAQMGKRAATWKKLYFCLVLLWKVFWWIIFCCKSQSFS